MRTPKAFPAAVSMPAILFLLCAFFTWATWTEGAPSGREGGIAVAQEMLRRDRLPPRILVVGGDDANGRAFVEAACEALATRTEVLRALGTPQQVRSRVDQVTADLKTPLVVVATPEASAWTLWSSLRASAPDLASLEVLGPSARGRSAFLSPTNLRNVADQIAVIAIIAVGMTMVIITGGIDLSVGSLVALSAVATAWLIRSMGGASASIGALVAACAGAVALSGLIGVFSGAVITAFRIPPFIATLAMMQVAAGLAFILARGQTIYDVPVAFTSLGRGEAIASLPNAVALMLFIYSCAHVMMVRTATGRRIYAVGGNAEAARLSGVSIARTLLFVYAVSGLMAGVGGVITASQLKAGSPTYGLMYELYVIAAVVVGGTSLSGGEGRIFGTLVGAFIIAVIRNGMNLMNVEAYTQKGVLGLVILGAVLVDRLRRRRSA
ncbi:MAG: ABC transporter permease [Chthonomonadales bacterium]|nr:ABC transporter permease [Chthonomonadales bacterium]